MEQLINVMMQSIKSEICGVELEQALLQDLSDSFLTELYRLSKSHDMAHIVGVALDKAGVLPKNEIGEKFRKQSLIALYRQQQLQYSFEQVCAVLEAEHIPYMPLKGAVIRPLYPEPWMRTSCDIDILVPKEDLSRTVELLVAHFHMEKEPYRNAHDISFYLPGDVHLEIHFTLEESIENLDRVLTKVWDHSHLEKDGESRYVQTNEFLLCYLLAHNAYHFIRGGCGVRPFLDWWLLRHRLSWDQVALDRLLEQADLKEFEKATTELANVWFSGQAHTPFTKEIETYILGAGVYGTMENQVMIANQQSENRVLYLLKRIFMPYRQLKNNYPILKKYPILFPIYTVKRWFRFATKKVRANAMTELKHTASYSDETAQRISAMCSALHLKTE